MPYYKLIAKRETQPPKLTSEQCCTVLYDVMEKKVKADIADEVKGSTKVL